MTESMIQRVASCVLGVMFLIGGVLKYPVFKNNYENLKKTMSIYVTIFPGKAFGFSVDPVSYMHVVGAVEFTCGLGLLLAPRKFKIVCSGVLVIIMIIGVYTMIKLGHYGECIFHLGLLIPLNCLAYSYWNNKYKKRD